MCKGAAASSLQDLSDIEAAVAEVDLDSSVLPGGHVPIEVVLPAAAFSLQIFNPVGIEPLDCVAEAALAVAVVPEEHKTLASRSEIDPYWLPGAAEPCEGDPS